MTVGGLALVGIPTIDVGGGAWFNCVREDEIGKDDVWIGSLRFPRCGGVDDDV